MALLAAKELIAPQEVWTAQVVTVQWRKGRLVVLVPEGVQRDEFEAPKFKRLASLELDCLSMVFVGKSDGGTQVRLIL